MVGECVHFWMERLRGLAGSDDICYEAGHENVEMLDHGVVPRTYLGPLNKKLR